MKGMQTDNNDNCIINLHIIAQQTSKNITNHLNHLNNIIDILLHSMSVLLC